MPRVHNPYFAGPPATQPDTFFGREDVLQFVDDALSSSMQNLIVFYGQRRIGKTSVLHQISRRNSQAYEAAFFDLQSGISNSSTDLLYGLARAVAGKLKLDKPDRAAFETDPDFLHTDFLPQVYRRLGDRRLLLLLDEFDVLSLKSGTTELDGLPFVQTLNRIIQNHNKQLIFLFVIGRRLKELPSQQLQIFRGALTRQINLLEKDATLKLIRQPAQGVLTYYDDAVEHIWALTGGHPYFTQLLCHEIFNQAQRGDKWQVSVADVEAAVDSAIKAGQSALEWFWDEVSLSERFTLYTLSQPDFNGSGASLDQLIAQRNAQGVQIPDFELRALPDRLVDREVLKRDAADRYGFAVELVRRWIAQAHSLEEVTSELIQSGVAEPAKDFFRAGQAAYKEEHFALALDNFNRALSINPDYVEARLWLARARLKKRDLLEAIDEFTYVERFGGQVAREARLGLADARAQYGLQLEENDQTDQAQTEYEQAVALDPQHLLANTRLSEIYLRQAQVTLQAEGALSAGPLYERALRSGFATDALETTITEQLDQYSRTQEEAKHWEEAEQASRLAARLISKVEDSRKALLRIQLGKARWHFDRQELDAAATIYRALLAETDSDTPRQVIENDVLRYSQQQEEQNHWSQAEETLALLVALFPDNFENQSRLIDSLGRQGEYFLEQNKLDEAKGAYQRAQAVNPENQSLRHLIRSGFQSYRQRQSSATDLQTSTLIREAMQTLVEVLGQKDMEASRWLSEARVGLGDALLAEGRLADAQAAYERAVDDITYVLQFAEPSDQVSSQERAGIWLKLAELDLRQSRFDSALENFERALIDSASDPEIVRDIKTIFASYCRRQEKIPRWNQVERAMDMLNRLFQDDEDVRFEAAQTRAAQTEWHLSRAIPDLEAAIRLAHSALIDSNLSYESSDHIAEQLKGAFHRHRLLQEQAEPPNWKQAEQAMNSLVSLLPGDDEVNLWLAETRVEQGNWYLSQQNQSAVQSRHALQQAAEAYRRALKDLPHHSEIVNRLKQNFNAYQQRRQQSKPPAWPLAVQALQILRDLIPGDDQVEQWLADAYLKQGVWLLQQTATEPAEAETYLTEAEQAFEQALKSHPAGKAEPESEILIQFRAYCQRQSRLDSPRWTLAQESLAVLGRLLPEADEVRQYQADLHLARADWLLAQPEADLTQVKNSYRLALEAVAKPNNTLVTHIQEKLKAHRLTMQAQEPPNWDEAERVVELLADLLPHDDETQWQLAEVKLERGSWLLQQPADDLDQAEALLAEAEPYYRQALEAVPAQQETVLAQLNEDFKQYRLKQLHHQPPRWQLAEHAMKIFVRLADGELDAQRRLAEVRAAWGRSYIQAEVQTDAEREQNLLQARAIYQRAVADLPDDASDLTRLIKDDFDALRQKQEQASPPKWDEAEQAMVVLAELLPRDPEVQSQLADGYLARGRHFANEAKAFGGWRREGQQAELFEQAGFYYSKAITAAARRAQITPLSAAAWQQLGLIKAELGDLCRYGLHDQAAAQTAYQDALANWQKAIELGIDATPNDSIATTYAAFGDILLERGDLAAAGQNYLAAKPFLDRESTWLNEVDSRLQNYQDRQRRLGFQKQVVDAGELRHHLQPENSEIWQALAGELVVYGNQFLHDNEFELAKPLYERAMAPVSSTIALDESSRQRLSQLIVQAVVTFITRQRQAENWRQAEEAEEWLNEVEFIKTKPEIPDPPPPRFWTTRWGIAAAVAAVILLCGGGLALGESGPMAPLLAAVAPATPTSTPTQTRRPTATVTPLPSSTPSPTATATATSPSPTAVIVVVTATNTPTRTPSPTVTPTPSPTATSTPTPFPAPQIVGPPDGEVLQGIEGPHQLLWEPVIAQLAPDQFYYIELEYSKDGQETRQTQLHTDTTWDIPTDLLLDVDPPERAISWQVTLVSSDGDIRAVEPLSRPSEARSFSWERIPLPPGESLSVEINPNNSQEILAIVRADGIYRSTNGGIDWHRVREETSVEELHVAPANPSIVYAGAYARVSKSADGGKTWAKFSDTPTTTQVYGLATDPNSADIVIAATGTSLFLSTNGGQSWSALDRAKSGQVLNVDFFSIAAGSTSQGNRVYAAGEGDQIYWRGTRDATEPWETLVCKVCARSIYSLAMDGDKLLAGTDEGRLAISTNLGNDWRRTDTPPTIPTLKFSTIVFDPNDSSIVYAGSGTNRNPTDGQGLFRSTDGGLSWSFLNTWHEGSGRGTYVQDIAIDETDSNTIFIATSQGLFRTEDGGQSWAKQ